MRRWSPLPRPFLATVAVFLAVIATLYGSLWMYDVRWPSSQVELGFNYQHSEVFDEKTHSVLVNDVVKDSPAERAGLRAGDRIIGVNGRMLSTSVPYDRGRRGLPHTNLLTLPACWFQISAKPDCDRARASTLAVPAVPHTFRGPLRRDLS